MSEELVKKIVGDMTQVMLSSLKHEMPTEDKLMSNDHINLVMTIIATLAGNVLVNINKSSEFFNIYKGILVLMNALHGGIITNGEKEYEKSFLNN